MNSLEEAMLEINSTNSQLFSITEFDSKFIKIPIILTGVIYFSRKNSVITNNLWLLQTNLVSQLFNGHSNGEPTLLVHCLYKMTPLNHKRTPSSLAPHICCAAKAKKIDK